MMDRQTAAKQNALPSSKGGGDKNNNNYRGLAFLKRHLNLPVPDKINYAHDKIKIASSFQYDYV